MQDNSLSSSITVASGSELAINGGKPYRKEPFGPRWVFSAEDLRQLESVLDRADTAWRSGNKIREFTTAFQTLFGVRNAIATGSGTSAIHAAVAALNPNPGDEIITTPATDIGTIIGILQHNLIPVFADWNAEEFNTCASDIERKITERTRAIIVVHLFGIPCDMEAIMKVSQQYKLPVIEDCAQAHLAEYNGRKVGTFGDIACYSFGLKTLTTNQGGMVSATDPDLAAAIRGFLSKGSVKIDGVWKPYSRLGTFSPMTDLQAAIGVAQIQRLEEATQVRQMAATAFDRVFAEIASITLPKTRTQDRCVYYLYPYHFNEKQAGMSLSCFVEALRAEGISDAFGPYLKGRALHRHPFLLDANTYGQSGYPLRDENGLPRVDYRVVCLPHIEARMPGLGFFHMRNSFTDADVADIVAAVRKVAKGLGLLNRVTKSLPEKMTKTEVPAIVAVTKKTVATKTDLKSKPAEYNLCDFGALGDNKVQSAPANDRAIVVLLQTLGECGGRIIVPQGIYRFNQPLSLVRKRNLQFIGAGGNPKYPGTRFLFSGAQKSNESGLELRSAVHCRFEGIDFVGQNNGPDNVVQLCCDEGGPDGLSTIAIDFSACTFRGGAESVGLLLRDSANISFRQCWFMQSKTSVQLGAPVRSACNSRSNGLANTIAFENCHFFEKLEGVRASGVRIVSSMFSSSAQCPGAGLDCGSRPDARVSNVTISNCFAIEARGGVLFRQGLRGSGLVFENNRVGGYECAVELDGLGAAVIRANTFDTANGMTTPVRIKCAPEACVIEANTERG